MGIQLPPELAGVAAQAGVKWPEADEDLLRQQAQAWRDAGTKLTNLTRDADHSASHTLHAVSGNVGEGARRHWSTFVAPDTGHLTATAHGCHAAADRLDHAAQQVGSAKVEIVRNLVNLAKNSDAAHTAANAGHPNALLGLDTAVRATNANVTNITNNLATAVVPGTGTDVNTVQPLANPNPGHHGPLATVTDLATGTVQDVAPGAAGPVQLHGDAGPPLGHPDTTGPVRIAPADLGHHLPVDAPTPPTGLPAAAGQTVQAGLAGPLVDPSAAAQVPPGAGGAPGQGLGLGSAGPIAGGAPTSGSGLISGAPVAGGSGLGGPGALDPSRPSGSSGVGGGAAPGPARPAGAGPGGLGGGGLPDPARPGGGSGVGGSPAPDPARPGGSSGGAAPGPGRPVVGPDALAKSGAGGLAEPVGSGRPGAGAGASAPGQPGPGQPGSGQQGAGQPGQPGGGSARPGAPAMPLSPGADSDVVRGKGPAVTAMPPGPQAVAQVAGAVVPREQRDDPTFLFWVHMFPIGHMPVKSERPARQLPPPPVEVDFAPGLRFAPGDHPQHDQIRATPADRVPVSHNESLPAEDPTVQQLAEGHDPLGGQHEREWDRRYLVRLGSVTPQGVSSAGREYAWPPGESYPEGGTAEGEPEVLKAGTVIDRFGSPRGRVFSAEGTAFARRSLPPEHLANGYRRYRVAKELPVWRAVSAPWFGQPGGGERYRTTYSAIELVALGYLEDLT